MAIAFNFADHYRVATRMETMGKVARKGLDPRLIKKSCVVNVQGDNFVLQKNDIVYVNKMTEQVIAFQKSGCFFLVEELVKC